MEEDYEASLSSPENDNELLDIQGQPEQEQSGEESDDNMTDDVNGWRSNRINLSWFEIYTGEYLF